MLTQADEYPIHQTPAPIAFAGTDRNFYDRFFFNGYSKSQPLFFAAALGFYPQLNIKDAAFSVISDGVQHNLRASAHLMMERMDMSIGPVGVKVQTPMLRIGLKIAENDHGISADLVFTGACELIEEPRFVSRIGTRVLFDYTRMTQNGSWSGWIQVLGKGYELEAGDVIGTRDRSWGLRPIGAPDKQPIVPETEPQFYWLWAPINCGDRTLLFAVNEYASGERWHTNALSTPHPAGFDGTGSDAHNPRRYPNLVLNYEMESGTRHQRATKAKISDPDKDEFVNLEFNHEYKFYMSGIGYTHRQWGHGSYHGEQALDYDAIDLNSVDATNPEYWHIQSVCKVACNDQNNVTWTGRGVLEQLVVGRHDPSGLGLPNAVAP